MHAHRASALAFLDDEQDDCSRYALRFLPGAPRAGLQAQG
jgi:hypothetical protein